MKFVLILMIKNESKIIKRCLEALENVVDCFCICDTGSTDNTCEIVNDFLQTHVGCLTHSTFKDFGTTRTISFQNAKKYVSKKLGWDLIKTYGLLLDADMVFVPNKLKEQNLTDLGYSIIQKNGNLEYYNARIIRMDFKWECVGVTHEYWSGPEKTLLGKDICFIDDHNDGGCKSDKFQRDMKLLQQGLVDEPNNVRYMFYLAQTYKCLSKFNDAIEMYKKRINAGGWLEEVWYSHYMIGECYKELNNIPLFESWMKLAYEYNPRRSESIYKLAEYYRIVSQHVKSYEYIKIGKTVPYPKKDTLFIEINVYNGLFDYEQSIVEYYIHPEKCLKTTIAFMLKSNQYQQNCLSNLKFSIKQLPSQSKKLSFQNPFEDEFRPSAISVLNYPFANCRFVNYEIQPDGTYKTPAGIVITKNAYTNLETGDSIAMKDVEPLFDTSVTGVEDLRLYENDNDILFTGTSYKQFIKDTISIVAGTYNLDTHALENVKGIESPTNAECEKNWVHVPKTSEFIYSWNPLRIMNSKFEIVKTIETPPLFSLFRGSAPPIERNDKWLVLVHFVEYCIPRKYYHCFVELTKEYTPIRISLPFFFKSSGIEYCISTRILEDNNIACYVSFNDCNPHEVTFLYSDLQWLSIDK